MKIEHVMMRAKEIANIQGRLANSPAEKTIEGALHLCSGSCIAYAAIEISGDLEYLSIFRDSILSSDKMALIPAVFEKYGLNSQWAKSVILQNDNLQESMRLDWFNLLTPSEVH